MRERERERERERDARSVWVRVDGGPFCIGQNNAHKVLLFTVIYELGDMRPVLCYLHSLFIYFCKTAHIMSQRWSCIKMHAVCWAVKLCSRPSQRTFMNVWTPLCAVCTEEHFCTMAAFRSHTHAHMLNGEHLNECKAGFIAAWLFEAYLLQM